MGNYSHAVIQRDGSNFTIINAYTQFNWSGKGVKADYAAIRLVFKQIKHNFPNSRIAYPLIGAGLAQGDWNVISKIIDEELAELDHILVRLPK